MVIGQGRVQVAMVVRQGWLQAVTVIGQERLQAAIVVGLGHLRKLYTFAHRANGRLLVTIIKPKNYVCADMRA